MEDVHKRHAWEQMGLLLENPMKELMSAVQKAKQVAAELETQRTQG